MHGGNVLSTTGSLASTVGKYNPFRYRSYYYDTETGWYYLNSRYYDPSVGRFINADGIIGAGDIQGYNIFAYCENNPVVRCDTNGQFWDIVFDVVSLGFSIYDVATHPDDGLAWAGLAGDALDLIPLVCGVGETIRAVNVASNVGKSIDDIADAADAINDTNKQLDAIKEVGSKLNNGDQYVYISRVNGKIEYVGITNSFDRRYAEWERKGRYIEHFIDNVNRDTARALEQIVIDQFGMSKNGGILANKINSISPHKPLDETAKSLRKLIFG